MIEASRAYCPICGGDVEAPADLLAGLAAAPMAIAEAVRSAPGGGEGWSPGEVAAHLADSEVAFAWRLRQVLAQDEPQLQPFDQDDWARALRYGERDTGASLACFAALRAVNVEILRRLSEAEWERRFRHPEFGHQTLRTLMRHEADHDLAHLRQIKASA